ncbi:Rrf2 family transcriptional regulator [Enterococcus sp. LJL90]
MRYSVRFSDAIHILAYIEMFQGTDLSSEMIAKSIETNPANVRKLMSYLRNSQLILTQNGKAKPTLARKPEEITLFDIYRSIEGESNLIQVDEKTNPACIVGGNIQKVLQAKYDDLQAAVEGEMKKITLAEIIHDISVDEVAQRPESFQTVSRFL